MVCSTAVCKWPVWMNCHWCTKMCMFEQQIIINTAMLSQRQGCYFTTLMTKHRWEGEAGRGAWNNILLIWICSMLQPLHPVNLSDSTISPRTAAIYMIFSLELTHDFIVLALAEVLQCLGMALLNSQDLVAVHGETCNTYLCSFCLILIHNLTFFTIYFPHILTPIETPLNVSQSSHVRNFYLYRSTCHVGE